MARSEEPGRRAAATAVEHFDSAILAVVSDAGHAFLFPHAKSFARQVANFLAG